MSKVLNFTILASIFLISTFFATSFALARRTPVQYEYPIRLNGSAISTNSLSEVLFFDDNWYVLTSPTVFQNFNAFTIAKWDYYFTSVIASTNFTASNTPELDTPTVCGGSVSGSQLVYYSQCYDLHYINSTHMGFTCTRDYKFSAGGYHETQLKYYELDFTTLTNLVEYQLDVNSGSCNDIYGRMSNMGSGVTGSSDSHIAFLNYLGVLKRVRNIRTTSPTYDAYPMPTISSLIKFQPFQSSSATGQACFHDGSADCGSWLVYTATTTSDTSKRLYVNEYSYGVCGFNPSHFCYFSGELFSLYSTKKIITDQAIGDFTVYKGSNYWEIIYQDFDTNGWWLAWFDESFNLISKYQLESQYGSPYYLKDSATVTNYTCGGSTCYYGVISSYDITAFNYNKFRFNCFFTTSSSVVSAICSVKATDTTNSSNFYNQTYSIGTTASLGAHNYFADLNLPDSLKHKNLKLEFNITNTGTNYVLSFNPQVQFFASGGINYQDMDIGLEDKRVIVWSGKQGIANITDTYSTPYTLGEQEVCACNPYSTDGCYGDQRKSTRTCYPPACDVEVKFEYDPACAGGCSPARYKCYNTTATCLWQSDCTWDLSDCSICPYFCNPSADACYDSPVCPSCPSPDMNQAPFPDCSCSCSNLCTLGYENISVSCACKSMTVDTQNWRDNPVSFFQDVSSGLVSMFGGLAIPLIILILAVGFGGIIAMIMKRAIK